MNFLKKNGAGLLLCLAISIPAWFLGKSFPVIGVTCLCHSNRHGFDTDIKRKRTVYRRN